MSTPVGSNVARSCTTTSRAPNSTFAPAERSLASAMQFADREFALGEDRQHGFADGAGGADDGYVEGLLGSLVLVILVGGCRRNRSGGVANLGVTLRLSGNRGAGGVFPLRAGEGGPKPDGQ